MLFVGNCLGAQTDDEDGPYLPTTDSRSESRFAKIKLKNIKPDEIGTSQALMRKNTDFFGVCKPGKKKKKQTILIQILFKVFN